MATLTFDRTLKTVTVLSPETEVDVLDVYSQAQDWLQQVANLDVLAFVTIGGRDALGGGEFTGLTLTLLDDWRIEFEARGGPAYIPCIVSGGNTVAINSFDNNPIKPSAFTQVQIRQSQSPTLIDRPIAIGFGS
jgi:hypothetical protein